MSGSHPMATPVSELISVTDPAAVKARHLLQEKGVEDGALRLFVVSGAWGRKTSCSPPVLVMEAA